MLELAGSAFTNVRWRHHDVTSLTPAGGDKWYDHVLRLFCLHLRVSLVPATVMLPTAGS